MNRDIYHITLCLLNKTSTVLQYIGFCLVITASKLLMNMNVRKVDSWFIKCHIYLAFDQEYIPCIITHLWPLFQSLSKRIDATRFFPGIGYRHFCIFGVLRWKNSGETLCFQFYYFWYIVPSCLITSLTRKALK